MKADSHGTSCERRAYGKALRDEVPRSSHASWNVETGRERPLELMLEQLDVFVERAEHCHQQLGLFNRD